jgi:uncharacterized Zn-finger protein
MLLIALESKHIILCSNHHRCPKCDMTCTTRSALASHMLYRHAEEKPFTCPRCDYRAKTIHDLKVRGIFFL